MMQRMRCCVVLALVLGLKVELPGQWSFEAGPGRLAVPIRASKSKSARGKPRPALQLPATVPIYQGSRLVGQGELLPWLPKAGIAELRALLPKGRFRLGVPRPRAGGRAVKDVPARIQTPSQLSGFEWREGVDFPRYRAQCTGLDVELRADLYRYPGRGIELRLRLFAAQKHAEDTRLQLQGELPLSWLEGRELRLAGSALGGTSELGLSYRRLGSTGADQKARLAWTLSIPPRYLRPGDEIEILLLALEGRDPEEKGIGPESLRKRLGQGPARRGIRPSGRLRGRVDQSLIRLLSETRRQSPLDRGDHIRSPASPDKPALWSHLEFDLPLGLYLLACERRDRPLIEAAWRGLAHLMGRDRSRPWRNETLGYRLPVRHGARHGIGAVTLGHVFLESALLLSALRANRGLFEEALESLDALSDLVPRSLREAKRLRDFAWPLTNLELGLRLVDRKSWENSAESLLDFLDRVFQDGCFDLRENNFPDGSSSLELWLVAGLLLPALDSSILRGSKKARSLQTRIVKRLRKLPGAKGGFVVRYTQTAKGRWYASKARVDPCYEIWLIEGLLGRKRMPASLRARRRRVLSRLPGEIWDPATRLAFLLRWPRLRAEIR